MSHDTLPHDPEPTLRDRLLWTLLSGIAVGAAAIIARRVSRYAWGRTTGRPPPRRMGGLSGMGEKLGTAAALFVMNRTEALGV